jgi:hypothetical protein
LHIETREIMKLVWLVILCITFSVISLSPSSAVTNAMEIGKVNSGTNNQILAGSVYVTVNLDLNAPPINQTAEVTCTVSNSGEENALIAAEIILPDGFIIVNGENSWTGIIDGGGTAIFNATIKSVHPGKWVIKALVRDFDEIIAQDFVYLYVGENSARMRKTYSYNLALESGTVPENLTILEEDWENLLENHSAGNSARIRGTIYARMMDGSFGPLRGAKFILYDPDLSILSISYTDWSGRFDSGWIPNVSYVYQTVIAETHSDWGVFVVNNVGDRYAVNRMINGPFVDGEYDVGLFYVEGNAWRIYDTIVEGWSFLYNEVGYHMLQVKVGWPQLDAIGPYAYTWLREIYLPESQRYPNMPNYPDIILAEYSDVVMFFVYGGQDGVRSLEIEAIIESMWGEGWSAFFSCAVRLDPTIASSAGLFDPWNNPIPKWNLETRKNVDNTGDPTSFYDELSPDQESIANTASALWDLYDPFYDPWLDNLDIVNFSFGNLWDIFVTRPTSFGSFWQRLKSELLTWPPDGLPYRDAHYAKAAVFQNGKPWVNNAPSSSIGSLAGTWQISPVTLTAIVLELDWEDRPYTSVEFWCSTDGENWQLAGVDEAPTPYQSPWSSYSIEWNVEDIEADSVRVYARAFDGMMYSLPSVTGPFDIDAGDTFDAATAIGPENFASSISGGDVDDYFKIHIDSNHRIDVSMAPPSTADFDLYLYNPSRSLIASSTQRGTGLPESISYTASSSGDYFVRVSKYSGTGTYGMSFASKVGSFTFSDVVDSGTQHFSAPYHTQLRITASQGGMLMGGGSSSGESIPADSSESISSEFVGYVVGAGRDGAISFIDDTKSEGSENVFVDESSWVEAGRGRDYVDYVNGRGEHRAQIYPGPIHTWDGESWVSYVFEDKGGDVKVSDGIYVAGCTSAPGTNVWDALLVKCLIE